MAPHVEQRAAKPQPPPPSRALQRALADQATHHAQRADLQRASMARALLLLVAIILVFSFTRAGWHNVFLPGWWRHW